MVLMGAVVAIYAFGQFPHPFSSVAETRMAEPVPSIPKVSGATLADALAEDKPRFSGPDIPILMYHHVGPLVNEDPMAQDLTVSSDDFEQQVIYFKRLGYESVTLAQIYANLHQGAALPARPIAFTFDDGYQDVFVNAVPILKQYGFVGSFAIATQLLGRPTYAVWDDVLMAQQQGMEIISHTENHLDLTSLKYSDEDLRREIFGSRQMLEEKLGQPVEFFVYPYGHHNAKVEALVREAGYKMALTTDYGTRITGSSLLAEPRVRVHGRDGLEKLKKIFSPVAHSVPAPLNP